MKISCLDERNGTAKRKRTIAFISALVMIMSSAIIIVATYDDQEIFAEVVEVDGIKYELNDEDRTAKVVSMNVEGLDVVVLNVVTLNGVTYKIITIGESVFDTNTTITSVNMPNVISIETNAFHGCTALESVEIPCAITIGYGAFWDCTALTSVEMPNVTSLDFRAFEGCTALTSVEMPEAMSIENSAFYRCTSLTSVEMPNATRLGGAAFKDCTSLTSVEMPSVITLAFSAFYGCTSLASVEMPKAEIINGAAFLGCITLTSIELPNVTTIRSNTFYGCTSLTSVTMPIVTSLGEYAFYGCTSLTSVTILNVTSLGEYAFYGCTSLTSVEIYSNPSFGNNSFYGCTSLTSVTMPNVTSIGNNAFKDCTSLVSVTMPNVTSIESGAFLNCTSLIHISIPHATFVGGAFYGCTSLVSIEMPNVLSIGDNAFYGCDSLKSIGVPHVTSIGSGAFRDCTSLTSVTMPNVTSLGRYAFWNCKTLESITMPSVTTLENHAFQKCEKLASISLPNLTSIGGDAFRDCTSLTSVTMPNAEYIGGSAFMNCTALSSMEMPNAISIGGDAFRDCTSLTSVTMPNAASIGSATFRYCTSLASVSMPSVTSVGGFAFEGCDALASVEMSNATFIGSIAFLGCTALSELTLFFGASDISTNDVLSEYLGTSAFSPGKLPGMPGTITKLIVKFNANLTNLYAVENNTLWLSSDAVNTTGNTLKVNGIAVEGADRAGHIYTYSETETAWISTSASKELFDVIVTIDDGNGAGSTICGYITGGGTYNIGETAKITAYSNPNYEFVKWSDGVTEETRENITTSGTYTAIFKVITHTITVESNDGDKGNVAIIGYDDGNFGPSHTSDFDRGSTITIKAEAKEDYEFIGWKDGPRSPEWTVTTTEEKTYTAIFKRPYIITVNMENNEGGYVTGSNKYYEGDIITITAVPSENCTFLKWNDGGSGNTDATRTITVTEEMTYTAIFMVPYEITVNVHENNGGKITVDGMEYSNGFKDVIFQHSTITINAIPQEGYRFVKWNDNDTDSDNAERIITVTEKRTYTATFEIVPVLTEPDAKPMDDNNGDDPDNLLLYVGIGVVVATIFVVLLYVFITRRP